MHQTLLSVENLNVSFMNGSPLKAVDNVSFEIFKEEILGLVGESGCGKTLTALSIIRLLPANASYSGRIVFEGKNLMGRPENDLRRLRGKDISMIFQEPMTSLNPVFTVGYQISEVLKCHLRLNKKQSIEKTISLLKTVGIPSPEIRAEEYPHQMSGGMRQRIMIAMSIACNPALIIADEPTTALDVTIQAQILELLDSLMRKNKMSLLLITHDLGVIAEWAHRVVIMYAGRVVEEAGVSDIFSNPRHPYTKGLLESIPKKGRGRLNPIPGVVPSLGELPDGCKFSTRCQHVIRQCQLKEPELLPFETHGDKNKSSIHLTRCIRANDL
jgi:oligopeptide/dipeptide ABC transporter ATP-binding protein